jgi:hypothetical protein
MLVYFLVLTGTCFWALASIFLPKYFSILKGPITLASYSFMCIFVGLRDQVGGDWYNYESIFQGIGDLKFLPSLFVTEPLYSMTNKLVALAGGDIHIVNLLCAVILLWSLLNFSRLVDVDPNLVLFISTPYLLFVVGMNYTRQSVAIGLCLNAVGYLRKNGTKMFYLLAFVAIFFHYSAVFVIFLKWMHSIKRVIIAICLFGFFWGIVGARYANYAGQDADMQSNGVWSRIFFIVIGLSIVFVQRLKWRHESNLYKMVLRSSIALIAILPLSLVLSTLADRICLYLFFVYVLGVGSSIKYSKPPFAYLYIWFITIFSYGIFTTWFVLSSHAAAYWFPYRNAAWMILSNSS